MTNEEAWNILINQCDCETKYTIEPYGDGYALYYGRCVHRHGYNLINMIEPAWNFNAEYIEYLINCGAKSIDNENTV